MSAADPNPAKRELLRYDDLTRDPIGQLGAVYERFGLRFSPTFASAMRDWMDDDQQLLSLFQLGPC